MWRFDKIASWGICCSRGIAKHDDRRGEDNTEWCLCLYNAWTYHQLSTTVPPAFCIAIANKRKVVLPHVLPIELYYWKKENLEFGIMDADISGYKVHITDMERSVCDAVKYRNKIGLDVCAEVMRTYLKKPNRNLARLQDYAKRLRVFNTLKNYLEIAIE